MPNRRISRFATLVCILMLAMAIPRLGFGQVLIVQSSAAEIYNQAVSGFTQTFTPTASLPGVSSIEEVEIVVLGPASAANNAQLTTRKYQSMQPKLIVAVGSLALKSVASLPGPVIYLLVPAPEAIVGARVALAGVMMTPSPAQQLAPIKKTFPGRTRIGLLHNPAVSGDFFKLAHDSTESVGLSLVSIPAASDREAILAVGEGAEKIDALLLTPDSSLISPTLLEALALFSLEKKIPLVAFAPKYLEYGAAMVVFASPLEMGYQAGRMAREHLGRPYTEKTSPTYVKEVSILTNPRIVRRMGTSSAPSASHKDRL